MQKAQDVENDVQAYRPMGPATDTMPSNPGTGPLKITEHVTQRF